MVHCISLLLRSYEKKRVVVRAGTKGHFCYLIFAGSVFVNIKDHNKQTGGYYYHTVSVLHKGCFFGVRCFAVCVCACVSCTTGRVTLGEQVCGEGPDKAWLNYLQARE